MPFNAMKNEIDLQLLFINGNRESQKAGAAPRR